MSPRPKRLPSRRQRGPVALLRGAALALAWAGVVGAGCAADPAADAGPAGWSVHHIEAGGALASVFAAAPDDAYAAGGRDGASLILRYDGVAWREEPTSLAAPLWWVYGDEAGGVWACGEKGALLHRGTAGWEKVTTGTSKTLYGVWIDAAGEVWAVGGDAHGQPGDAVVLRGGVGGLSAVDVPKDLMPSVLFKVYGTPAGDVVAVGDSGTVLRLRAGQPAATWSRDVVPTEGTLTSLWGGGGERLFAVGAENAGLLLAHDGEGWTHHAAVAPGAALFGVFKAPQGPLFAVGAGARIVEVSADGASPPQEPEVRGIIEGTVLHSVFGATGGPVWAVGGNFFADPADWRGVIAIRR